ncbi:Na/Pi cotransporter family protein [Campylobacter jejuni]|nr:Na/Pi cotransporter family protein [Campylobacter jejuni]ECO8167170.1 Na/Pi cotransporter family protein [Campylobacter jejuni]EEU7360360.1 Na/Pi cotransporter family protein [Campylobacter jejuni]
MTNLGIGFKAFSGGLLEKILAKSTDTKIKSILFGTLIMQSSTLVSIITISFLSAGLISLGAGIGIIFGANLGNTASSWLIVGLTNIKISMLAIPLLIIGVLFFFQKDSVLKGLGNIFIGIGFFFLGVDYIKSGFENFKHIIDLSRFDFAGFKGAFVF